MHHIGHVAHSATQQLGFGAKRLPCIKLDIHGIEPHIESAHVFKFNNALSNVMWGQWSFA